MSTTLAFMYAHCAHIYIIYRFNWRCYCQQLFVRISFFFMRNEHFAVALLLLFPRISHKNTNNNKKQSHSIQCVLFAIAFVRCVEHETWHNSSCKFRIELKIWPNSVVYSMRRIFLMLKQQIKTDVVELKWEHENEFLLKLNTLSFLSLSLSLSHFGSSTDCFKIECSGFISNMQIHAKETEHQNKRSAKKKPITKNTLQQQNIEFYWSERL